MNNDELVLSSAQRLFSDVADIQSVIASRDGAWKQALWNGIEETGLNIAAVPEELGGAGIGLQSSLGILRVAGRMALSTPLAETMLAAWMLGAAGLEVPSGKLAFGPASFADRLTLKGDRISGTLARLPFARDCGQAVVLVESADSLVVALIALDASMISARESLAYEPVDFVTLNDCRIIASAPAPASFTPETSLLMGAAARAMQIAGALEQILALTSEYVTQRRAFEKTISKFQSVQHSVAQLAGEVAVSLSASASASEALEQLLAQGRSFDDPELVLEIISAKVRASSAAQKGAAIAHQMHGAIGVTSEHALHRLTLRALAWRDDYGNESEWATRLGQRVCAQGEQALWPLLAKR
ncbi:acyl-CoA/acyl-ACP dehydrogenase [Diaphorobacter sp. HDW4A]|uniref:acyl-CoA dehydrogenase family protein n=1 Tax=Diaphorobacter sp. HDW4A TaxID=2714924 RepID=UPI00140D5070|nr:acyl-CoA dehydrogenase family protein [Diaphorobacter sp. HDW4A]QIL80165.1 acyl-CoA/acyl-ACP dehydrogenase [Diaphorobacter sp. HDW4A]